MIKDKIGIVGNGLLATHFMHYLDLEDVEYLNWSRSKDKNSAGNKLSNCNPIVILISDDSIESFILNDPELENKEIIHFSGSLTLDLAYGFHPLMTFSKELYSLNEYREIPFIGELGKKKFKHFFPKLKNPNYSINPEYKPLYHALCVISGNFTNIVWHKTFKDFEEKLNLPREILTPYLYKTAENIKNNPFTSLTGPIKRGDIGTIKKNKKALKSKLWRRIYSLFNRVYKKEIK